MSGIHRINLSTAWCPPPEGIPPEPWIRRFGRPDRIEPGDSIWLVIESPVGCTVRLNGVGLGVVPPRGTGRHDVTGLLEVRNELALAPALPMLPKANMPERLERCTLPAEIGFVRLEIGSAPVIPHESP